MTILMPFGNEKYDEIFCYAFNHFLNLKENEMKEIQKIRQDYELPSCVESWGWKYHHIGIPTDRIMSNEKYLPQLKFFVSGFSYSPWGIEWMRFEKNCPIDKLIRTIPHIAFKVEDLDAELKKRDLNIITKPTPPSDGVRVAMIEHNGAPIELIEFVNDNN